MFPNKHAVYLHGTPGKTLFGKESRAFSSGCIQLQNPLETAQQLLDRGWDEARIQQIIKSKKTRSVKLARPTAGIMFYLAELPAGDGEFHALRDYDNRDPAVLEELNAEFQPNKKSAKR